MKNRKVLIWSLVILLLLLAGLLLYIYRDRIFKSKSNGTGDGLDDQTDSETPPPGFPLQRGRNNNYVKKLQEYLLTKQPNCLPNFGTDGDWGDETESCVMSVLGINAITYAKYKELGLA